MILLSKILLGLFSLSNIPDIIKIENITQVDLHMYESLDGVYWLENNGHF